jgi:hypothetical protein
VPVASQAPPAAEVAVEVEVRADPPNPVEPAVVMESSADSISQPLDSGVSPLASSADEPPTSHQPGGHSKKQKKARKHRRRKRSDSLTESRPNVEIAVTEKPGSPEKLEDTVVPTTDEQELGAEQKRKQKEADRAARRQALGLDVKTEKENGTKAEPADNHGQGTEAENDIKAAVKTSKDKADKDKGQKGYEESGHKEEGDKVHSKEVLADKESKESKPEEPKPDKAKLEKVKAAKEPKADRNTANTANTAKENKADAEKDTKKIKGDEPVVKSEGGGEHTNSLRALLSNLHSALGGSATYEVTRLTLTEQDLPDGVAPRSLGKKKSHAHSLVGCVLTFQDLDPRTLGGRSKRDSEGRRDSGRRRKGIVNGDHIVIVLS